MVHINFMRTAQVWMSKREQLLQQRRQEQPLQRVLFPLLRLPKD